MSSNANSNRDDDKFFPPRTDEDKPKAPGAFTQQFMGAASAPTGPVSPLDSKTPASATPFTAQFGSMNSFSSAPESGTGSVPERVSTDIQQPASSGSFTTMFGSNATPQKPAIEPQTEVTRIFERATKSQVPQQTQPTGFTEMFGSVRSAAPESAKPSVSSDPFEAKTPDFTELFKSPASAPPSTPAAQVPLSPLSAQPGTGRFTELFKNELPSAMPKPAPAPTPFSSSGPSGFTELFKTSSISAQPSVPPPATLPVTEPTPGGFTQLFKGSVPSARPTPVSPKPAGELTQMISGSSLTSKPPSPNPGDAPQGGATRLFSAESAAPAMAPLPPGPSEYTRIVSPRQLRELQQATPASSPVPSATGQAPAMSGAPQMPGWPPLSAPPMPQVAPSWQPPQVQPSPAVTWQPPQVPNVPAAFPPAAAPTPSPKAESKILTYLPLIIGLNVLFLIAVLLILLFALKR